MARFSTFLLPLVLCALTIVAYRPLLSPASEWGMLHSDYATFHSAACLKQRMSLPCLQWMVDGRAAAEFGVFEPVAWVFHSTLLTINNGFLTSHSWHVVSLLEHMACAVALFFAGEQLLTLVDGRDPENRRGLYRMPMFFASLYWSINPQRVEAVAWASAYSIPWATFFALWSIYCFVRSTHRDIPWRFLSWILYVAASWSSALMLPLAFCYVLIDYLVILPRTRARLLADALRTPGAKPGKSLTTDSPLLDALNAALRGTIFLLAWACGFFLANTSAFRAAAAADHPSDDSLIPTNGQLFLAQASRYLDGSTFSSRLFRSLGALTWYMKETVYPSNLHLFQTRHVPLAEESLARLLLPQNQTELMDTLTVGAILVVLVACVLARKQKVFGVCVGAFLLLVAPISGFFNVAPSSSPATSSYVADRWVYFASCWLAPFLAWWIIKEDVVQGTAAADAVPAALAEQTTTAEAKKATMPAGLKQRKGAAAAAATTTTAAAASSAASTPASVVAKRLPVRKQPLFTWLAPRLILALTLISLGMFLVHLTPDEVRHYRTLTGSCARVLALDPDVVECREILGITHFRAGEYTQALEHLARLDDLHSRSVVAYVCRATILSEEEHFSLAESTRSFEAALALQAHSPYVLTAWAKVQQGRNATMEAMTTLERCISHNPEYTEAYYLLSEIARQMGDHHTADSYKGQADMLVTNQAYQRATGQRIDADSPASAREGLTRATEEQGTPR